MKTKAVFYLNLGKITIKQYTNKEDQNNEYAVFDENNKIIYIDIYLDSAIKFVLGLYF